MTRPAHGASNLDWRRATEDVIISAYIPSEKIGTEGADGIHDNRNVADSDAARRSSSRPSEP